MLYESVLRNGGADHATYQRFGDGQSVWSVAMAGVVVIRDLQSQSHKHVMRAVSWNRNPNSKFRNE